MHSEPDEFVTVGAYGTPFEAELVASQLEAVELHPVLLDAEMVRIDWLMSNAIGGVKVQVPRDELEAAQRLLQSETDVEGAAPIACPKCGSTETANYHERRGAALSWLVLGIPAIPTRSGTRCALCGHTF